MKKKTKVITEYLPDGQILKVRLMVKYVVNGRCLWNISSAVSKSHRQLNDWEKERKNKRSKQLRKKMTGTLGPGVFARIIRATRKLYVELKPGDALTFRCESCVPDKQYRVFSKWLLQREKEPWETLPEVKGFFLRKPEQKVFSKDLYEEICTQNVSVAFLLTMHDILANPITWIVIGALSEIIGLSPLKENSVIQLILKAVLQLKPSVKK